MNNLKRTIKMVMLISIGLLISCFVMFVKIDFARADINSMLNFSGKVTNTDGTEIADGNYNFSFSLYTAPEGGSAIWSENLTAAARFSGAISGVSSGASSTIYTYGGASATSSLRLGQYLTNTITGEKALIVNYNIASSTITVAGTDLWSIAENINNRPYVEGGVINENLGSVSDLSAVDFNQTLYLEIIFNGETMQPRKMLTADPYAFEASRLGGKSGDEFASLAEDEIITGEWDFNNVVDIATSAAVSALTVVQNGSGNIVEFKYGATTALAILPDGRVQIGEYTLPAVDGDSGYVLKSDGFGNISWAPDIAGSGGGSGLWASSSNNQWIFQADVGQIVVLGNNATSSFANMQFEVTGGSLFDNVSIRQQNQLRFYDADSSNYVEWQATSSMSGNYTLTLPGSAGALGEALVLDSSGNLVWGSPTSFTYVNAGTAGQMSYYASDGSALSATSSLFISPAGYFGIGTITPAQLLTVGATAGSQFMVDASGQIVSGTWQGDIISETYGGTGQGTWQSGSLVFATSSNDLDELLIGTAGYIIQSVNGKPAWVSTTSLGIDINATGGVLSVSKGGTGQDFSSSTGFIYLDNGLASASGTIAITNTDLAANSGIILTGNTLTLDASGDWTGVFDGLEGNQYFTLSAWYATTTDALSEGGINRYYSTSLFAADLSATTTDALSQGSVNRYYSTSLFASDLAGTSTDALQQGSTNLYWSDALFDNRLSATTSLPNLITLSGLSEIGTIATGTWQGDVIDVAYGGTGISTISSQSLLFATSSNVISEFIVGNEGEVLVVSSGKLAWASTSPAASHSILSVTHSDTSATSTLEQGDILAVDSSGKWNRLAHGPTGYILYFDGTDTVWSTTTNITALGTIVQGIWHANTIEIEYGGTGATTATGARENLDLDEIYKFGINATGTDGYVWQSDGDGRGQWVATGTLGLSSGSSGQISKFIGTTTATTDGIIATGTLQGYAAANNICASEYSGSHFCRTYDIIVSINEDDISGWGGSAWIAEGPPGYTSNSNDCKGWINNDTDYLGAYWKFASSTGGYGVLTVCTSEKALACCTWQ